jgi:hypothetical protein
MKEKKHIRKNGKKERQNERKKEVKNEWIKKEKEKMTNMLSRIAVTTDGVLDLRVGLFATYPHDSDLHAITAPPLLFTIHKSPQHPLSLFSSLLCLHQPFPANGF